MEPIPKAEFSIVTRTSAKAWLPELIASAGPEVTETYIDDITGEVLKGPLSVFQSTSARDLDDVLPADRGHLPNHAGERADGVR